MNNWSFNPLFPNVLYRKINSIDDYIAAIKDLKNSINISAKIYDEFLEYELFPFGGDEDSWNKYFLKEGLQCCEVTEQSLRLIPNRDELPAIIVFSANYSNLYWISINSL